MPDRFDNAQGYVDRSRAQLALGQVELAADSLLAALHREQEFPKLLTQAYLDFPALVATAPLPARYESALAVLSAHSARPMFPVDHFLWNGSLALILSACGRQAEARAFAVAAVDASTKAASGFRYHPSVGLVTGQHQDMVRRLTEIVAA